MIEYQREEQTELIRAKGFLVKVIGVGGAGSNVLDQIALDGMEDAELICMNTDVRTLKTSTAHAKVQIGKQLTRGLGAGGDPELGILASEEAEEEIRAAVRGQNMIFICAGLGGGTGSGAAPTISRIAKEEGAFVVVFATMPFSFEGRRRIQQAETALKLLERSADALITFENDRMGELVLPKEGIQQAFGNADKIISQSVRAITYVVTQPGLIQIGMDDLLTALKNPVSRCLFGYGEAKGKNRAQEALKVALRSPLLDRGKLLGKSRNALVHVVGGASMSLYEVELLMNEMSKHVGNDTQILFGAGTDDKMEDRLSVTIISSLTLEELRKHETDLANTSHVIDVPSTTTTSRVESEPAPKPDAPADKPQASEPDEDHQAQEEARAQEAAEARQAEEDARAQAEAEADAARKREREEAEAQAKAKAEAEAQRQEREAKEAAEAKAQAKAQESKEAEERARKEAKAEEEAEERARREAFEKRRAELKKTASQPQPASPPQKEEPEAKSAVPEPTPKPRAANAEDLKEQRRRAQEELERKRAELERLLKMEDEANAVGKRSNNAAPPQPKPKAAPVISSPDPADAPPVIDLDNVDLDQTQRVSVPPQPRQSLPPSRKSGTPAPVPPAKPLAPKVKPAAPADATARQPEKAQVAQVELELEPLKGRFEKATPTMMDGENLDVPTFFRKRGKKG